MEKLKKPLMIYVTIVALSALALGFSDQIFSNYYKDAYNATAEMRGFIITLATGSSKGISHAGCTCIAISGIVMALGMVFDRTDTMDADVSYTLDLAQKLHDRFCSHHPLPCHHISIRDLDPNLNTHTQQCIHFTCEIACEITRIICRDKNISIIDNIN